ncbi:C2H2-type zinc finger protein [Flavivirga rizhaonensis]|uniref:C2H2-type zinc finger protein n=1 Tax=Flavivirga rizhaonensis TaxID=2559571 RepID=A0A4S1DZA3_9FLAO|nr:C2H2-type zinc finger protein [Flavivirga rizhaonensis]TGV03586.1 C2H2-type zinc finger protein [Flavivirga rizhaonensis]
MKKFILNEAFGILALTVLLIPQIAHTIYVFKINSHYADPWFGWCYAIGVDLAILIFTVKGWTRTAYAYFVGTLAHNLVYQFYPQSVWSSVLICIMLSATIFSFSHLFYHKDKAHNHKDTAEQPQATAESLRMSAAIEAGIRFEAQPYVCPQCSESFVNAKKLNGHISGHKQKGEWQPDQYEASWEQENKRRFEMSYS